MDGYAGFRIAARDEGFGTELREQVDLDSLSLAQAVMVKETVQRQQAVLWMTETQDQEAELKEEARRR